MDIDRRTFLLGGSAAALSLTIGLPAFAKSGPVTAQISGVQHFNVGDITVSALADGSIELDPSLFPTAGKDELAGRIEARLHGRRWQDPRRGERLCRPSR